MDEIKTGIYKLIYSVGIALAGIWVASVVCEVPISSGLKVWVASMAVAVATDVAARLWRATR